MELDIFQFYLMFTIDVFLSRFKDFWVYLTDHFSGIIFVALPVPIIVSRFNYFLQVT